MFEYSEATPETTLLNNGIDLDIHKSSYANIRWSVTPDAIITIDSKYEANLPGLAFDYYGDQSVWRAILAFNGLSDPISDVIVGSIIGMPNRSSLDKFMTANSDSATNTVLTI